MKGQETTYNVPDCDYSGWSHKGQLEAYDWIDECDALFQKSKHTKEIKNVNNERAA
jgi:hypothetical protein